MKQLKLSWLWAFFVLIISAGVFVGCQKEASSPDVMSGAKGKTKYDAVTLTCAGGDQTTIDLLITAGATGAPAGFSIQWMKKADLDALNGVWPASDDPALCKASFSGKAYGNTYALSPNGSITITLGDLLMEYANGGSIKGNSEDCMGPFVCGTAYAFRAFAHGDNKLNRSDFSFGECETDACNADGSCARHWYGWWKTHLADHQEAFIAIVDKEAKNYMQVGTVLYSANDILAILNQPSGGNGLLILAHQLISAKLNGGPSTAIDAGDNAVGNLVIPPVGTSDLKYSAINLPQLVGNLHKYNNCKIN